MHSARPLILSDYDELADNFGMAIVCSDAAAEAAWYDFTAVDRVERFLVLAVVSQGDHNIELSSPPERYLQFKTRIRFLVGVKYEEKDVLMDTGES
ncbi:hypothetical protein GH714_015904 [Hevea brasiliensis]|uniref:Uncharacterized protein n=1 Tax=Hevea brasiliensis TaxID=3981 RepID=A0A6A6LH67_HEVBR|nr:hypothetical protein GH714_015904 [Hevea brasiliensis]